MEEIIWHIFAGIGIIIVGLFVVGLFSTIFQSNEEYARGCIKGILVYKDLTYEKLWKKIYDNKRIIYLEDLTLEQMTEMVTIINNNWANFYKTGFNIQRKAE